MPRVSGIIWQTKKIRVNVLGANRTRDLLLRRQPLYPLSYEDLLSGGNSINQVGDFLNELIAGNGQPQMDSSKWT